jgi:acyl dehydratase
MQKIFEVVSAAELLAVRVGATGLSDWLTMDQSLIHGFAAATGDWQWIHVDVERAAREAPGGRTIAHGYLTLSLTPQLLDQTWRIQNQRQSLNYGLEHVRFISPVPCGSRIRLRNRVAGLEEWRGTGVKLTMDCQVEIEGAERPAVAFTQVAIFDFPDT